MKPVFKINRLSDFKFMGSVIQECLRHGQKPELWLSQLNISHTTKYYEAPRVEKIPEILKGCAIRYFNSNDELHRLIEGSGPILFFSTEPPLCPKPENQRWIHLVTSNYDSLCLNPASTLNRFDAIFFNTQIWIKKGIQYYQLTNQLGELEQEIHHKSDAAGGTQYDATLINQKVTSRQRLGLPLNKKVVTLFAWELPSTFWCARVFRENSFLKRLWWLLILPFSYPYIFSKIGKKKLFGLTLKSILDRPGFFIEACRCRGEKKVLQAIREFCDRHDAVLVLKARKKRILKDYEIQNADVLLQEDLDFFPSTSSHAISASDLCIAFFSTAAVESAAAGVRTLNLTPRRQKDLVRDHHLLHKLNHAEIHGLADEKMHYNTSPDAPFHFPGIIDSYEVNAFIRFLKRATFEDLKPQPEAFSHYVQKFIRPNPSISAAENIFSLLQKKEWI